MNIKDNVHEWLDGITIFFFWKEKGERTRSVYEKIKKNNNNGISKVTKEVNLEKPAMTQNSQWSNVKT